MGNRTISAQQSQAVSAWGTVYRDTPHMCPVPIDCESSLDNRVGDATALIQAALGEDYSVQKFAFRLCDAAEVASDACDPPNDQTRDNALAFLTVFTAQIAAIMLGKTVMKCAVPASHGLLRFTQLSFFTPPPWQV